LFHLYSKQFQFFIPQQSFSLFVPSFLFNISDRTANVALNSNGRYNQLPSVTIHTLLRADVLILALETPDKEDVKTLLAAMKDGGHEVITVPHVVIYSTVRGKC
jgi:hypothetical protein